MQQVLSSLTQGVFKQLVFDKISFSETKKITFVIVHFSRFVFRICFTKSGQ